LLLPIAIAVVLGPLVAGLMFCLLAGYTLVFAIRIADLFRM
jgi:hypothetical protein